MLRGLFGNIFLPHHKIAGLTALFISAAWHNLAISLIGIFIPLYIISITKSVQLVFAYYAISSLAVIISIIPAAKFVSRFGFRRSAVIGTLLLTLTIVLLLVGNQSIYLLLLSPVLGGIYVSFYWLPYHLIFSEDGRSDSFGRDISSMEMVSRIAQAGGPLIGGLIIALFGFNILYFISVISLILSVFPLTVMNHHPIHQAPNTSDIRNYFRTIDGQKWGRMFALTHFEGYVLDIIWPIYAFSVIKSYETLGGVASASLIFSIIVLGIGGRITDRFNKALVMFFGGIVSLLGWFSLSFSLTPALILISSLILKSARVFSVVPFEALFYSRVLQNKGDDLKFLVYREIVLHGSRLLMMLVFILISAFGFPWFILFILAGFVYPVVSYSSRNK